MRLTLAWPLRKQRPHCSGGPHADRHRDERFPLTEALRDRAERRLLFALTCCGEHIRRVVMRLSDVNGPRGGPDKRCRLRLKLAGLPDLVVEDTQTDLYVAIDRATDRTGRTLVRKIGRRQTLLRHVGLLVSD